MGDLLGLSLLTLEERLRPTQNEDHLPALDVEHATAEFKLAVLRRTFDRLSRRHAALTERPLGMRDDEYLELESWRDRALAAERLAAYALERCRALNERIRDLEAKAEGSANGR